MNVEFRRKEVSWCLDYDGGQICLSGIMLDDRIITLRIISGDFQVDIAKLEIDSFLNLLKTSGAIKEPEGTPEPYTEPQDALRPHFIPDKNEIATLETRISELSKMESEVQEEAFSTTQRERIPPQLPLEDSPSKPPEPFVMFASDRLQSLEKASVSSETPLTTEDASSVPESEIFDQKTDIASFFGVKPLETDQVPEEKSPLELLLEEEVGSPTYDQERKYDQGSEDASLGINSQTVKEEQPDDVYQSLEDLAQDFFGTSENVIQETSSDTTFTSDLVEREPEFGREVENDTTAINERETESSDLLEPPPMPPLEEADPETQMDDQEKDKKPTKSRRAELNKLLWELTRGY
ncbi:MAG: hypothetical protein ACFFE8_15295 [Candidatus Heimdallarchaeota archaeon]